MKSTGKTVLLAVVHVALLLAVFASVPKEAMAQRIVGVSVGDWSLYTVESSGNASLIGLEGLVTAKITVTAISGTNVTCQTLGTFSNSSETTETRVIDVDTGAGNATGFFIAANLNKDDLVYTGSSNFIPGATINETTTRSYLGSSAEVNHFNGSFALVFPPVANFSMRFNFYWFRSTGFMAETIVEFTNTTSTGYTWENLHATITQAIPEFPQTMILPLFMTLSLIPIIVLLKRRTPRKQ